MPDLLLERPLGNPPATTLRGLGSAKFALNAWDASSDCVGIDSASALFEVQTMSEEENPRIILPMPLALLAEIETYQQSEGLRSRAAAIRRLIEIGLGADALDRSSRLRGATEKS